MFFFKIFNNNNPVVFFLMPLLLVLIWIKSFINGIQLPVDSSIQMPLFAIFSELTFQKTFLTLLLALGLIIGQIILLIRLNVKYIFIENRSFLPAFLFILISGSFLPLQQLYPALCGNIFLLFAMNKLLSTYKQEKNFSKVFDISFLISIGSLFYFNLVYFLVFIWIAFLILKPFRLGEWLISVLGFVTPYFFMASYYYLADKPDGFWGLIKSNFYYKATHFLWNYSYYIFIFFLMFLALISTLYFLQGINVKKIMTRRYYTVLILLVIYSVLPFVFLKSASIELLIVISLPLSFLISYYLVTLRKKWIQELWIVVLLFLLIFIQYYN